MITATQKYQLWPFVAMENNFYSIPDAMLYKVYMDLIETGKLSVTFYSGGVVSYQDFLDYVKNPRNHFIFVIDAEKKQIIFCAWINNIEHKTAFCHFTSIGNSVYRNEIGELILDYWKSINVLTVLVGIVPVINKTAIKLAEYLGFVPLGVIPKLCYMENKQQSVGGMILYYIFGGDDNG